jgi:hypothetical protein
MAGTDVLLLKVDYSLENISLIEITEIIRQFYISLAEMLLWRNRALLSGTQIPEALLPTVSE